MRLPGVRYNGHPGAPTSPDPVWYHEELARDFMVFANPPDRGAHIRQIALLTRDSIGVAAPTLLVERLARGIRNARRAGPIIVWAARVAAALVDRQSRRSYRRKWAIQEAGRINTWMTGLPAKLPGRTADAPGKRQPGTAPRNYPENGGERPWKYGPARPDLVG